MTRQPGHAMTGGSEGRMRAFEVLLGRRDADLAVVNGRIVNVHTGAVSPGGVAVAGDRIVWSGEVNGMVGRATKVIDAQGRFVTPGLIETHAHSYHSNLNPTEYARLCLRRGTTTVTEAFYGQGQLGGVEAVRFSLAELRATPLGVLFCVPVLAYLQNVELGLAPTPTGLSAADLFEQLEWEGCVGLEEPPYIPFKERETTIERLAAKARERGQVIMGHGAGLSTSDLAAYSAMGITADHECVSAAEAVERVEAGMMVSMRECAISHDQVAVQRAITEQGLDPSMFMFSVDVPDAVTMARSGHVDHQIRLAVDGGVDPVAAVQMATINAARYYRVDESLGSLSPGRVADVLVVGDLRRFDVAHVVAKGEHVIEEGNDLVPLEPPVYPATFRSSIKLKRPVTAADLRIPAPPGRSTAVARAIAGAELLSEERHVEVPCVDGDVPPDVAQDTLKAAMVDRFGRSEVPAVGFIQGYGLKRGAIGTTYNPYTNNPMALGTTDADVAHAINAVVEMGGGFVAVADGQILGSAPLPLLGLLSDRPADEVVTALEQLYEIVADLGCDIERPFHQLAFTAVGGELPRLKLSSEGVFDVERREVLAPLVD